MIKISLAHRIALLVSFLTISTLLYGCATTSKTEILKKAEAHYKLGVSYMSMKRFKNAFIEFQKAIKIDPEHKESYNSLGYISTRFKKYEDAISYYKKALSIDPQYSDAMNNLGVTYMELGKWDEAIKYFEMAIENPFYATPERAYTNMAFAYYKKGDFKSAEEALSEALTRSPDFPVAQYIHGLLNVASGDDISAIDDFKKVLSIIPDYMNAHWEIAHAYLRIGERDKALEHFRIIAEKSDDQERAKEAKEYIMLLGK
jgi:type IV pilus biogenesis/stability protein PilW